MWSRGFRFATVPETRVVRDTGRSDRADVAPTHGDAGHRTAGGQQISIGHRGSPIGERVLLNRSLARATLGDRARNVRVVGRDSAARPCTPPCADTWSADYFGGSFVGDQLRIDDIARQFRGRGVGSAGAIGPPVIRRGRLCIGGLDDTSVASTIHGANMRM